MTIHGRERLDEARRFRDDGEPVLAENIGNVILRPRVDGDGEDRLSETARLHHGAPRILDAVAAFVMVEIIGLAIREDKQQPPRAG